MQKFAPDPVVHSHTARDVVHVASDRIAKICDLVDESNLSCEKGVSSVFDQLCCFEGSYHYWGFDQIERSIKVLHHRDRLRLVAADDDPIGSHKIFNSCSLA